MTTVEEADSWVGRTAIDRAGRRLGEITQVWIDDQSGVPAWATVETGWMCRREVIVPLKGVRDVRGRQQLVCLRADAWSAPPVAEDGHFGLDDEWRLFTHYDLRGPSDPTRHDPERGLLALTTGRAGRLGSGTSPRVFMADIRRTLGLR